MARKKGPTTPVYARLKQEEIEILDKIAAEQSRDRASQISHYVREGMKREKR